MHSVTVRLRFIDLVRAQFQLARGPRFVKIIFFACLLITAYSVYRGPHHDVAISVAAVLLTALAFTLGGVLLIHLALAILLFLRLRGRPASTGARDYVIAPEGLRERAEKFDNLVPWSWVEKVSRTGAFVFIRLRAGRFCVIPRRSFPDQTADAEFWNALQPLVGKKEN